MNYDDYWYIWAILEWIVMLLPLIYPTYLKVTGKRTICTTSIVLDAISSLLLIMYINFEAMYTNYPDNHLYDIVSQMLLIFWLTYYVVYVGVVIGCRIAKLNTVPGQLTYNVSRLVGKMMSEGQLRTLIKNKAETPPFILIYGEAGHDHTTIYRHYKVYPYKYEDTSVTKYVKTFETFNEFRFQTWEPSYYIPKLNPDESFTVNITTGYSFTPQSNELLNDRVQDAMNTVRGMDSKFSVKWDGNLPNYFDEFVKVGDPGGCCRSCLFEFGYLSLIVWALMLALGLSTVYEASMLRNIREVHCPINKFIDIGDSYHALYGQKCIIKPDKDHSDEEQSTSSHEKTSNHYHSHKRKHHHKNEYYNDDDDDSSFSSENMNEEL